MARIAGVTLPNEKQVGTGLTYVYGIGPAVAANILKQAQVDPAIRIKDLSDDQVNKLRELIEKNLKVEGELKREVLMNIKRLKEIDSYRGSRHSRSLPARGQRTKTNNRTRRGNKRVTMGSGRTKTGQKT